MSGGPGWVGAPPRHVCIVMLSALGDAVHVLPVANALARAWPKAHVTWIIQPLAHRLVSGHSAIDEFVIFRRRRGLTAWQSYADLARTLRGRSFDLLLGLQVYLKAGLVTALAPARVKLGFDLRRARDLQWLFTNRRIPPHAPQHVQDQYLEFVRWLGIDPEPVQWNLCLTDAEREAQRAYFRRFDAPACALVVGTSKPGKNWTAAGYARVCEEVARRHGLRPVIVGGPSALERRMADEISALSRVPVADELGDDLRRLVWLVDGSAVVVSPDTGPLHVARALGTPVVGLYGYTNPKRSGPYRAFEDLLVDGYAERPDENYDASPRYRNGMGRITADAVLEKVATAVQRYGLGEGRR